LVAALTPEDHDFEPEPAYRFEFIKQQYYESIEQAGGLPLVIPSTENLLMIPRYLELIDGLLLIGGEDIHPSLYDQRLHPTTRPQAPRRDQLEIEMVRGCRRLDLPVLGICRGLQLINVACGGTLHQELTVVEEAGEHRQQGELDFSTRHPVLIQPGSRLHDIIGAGRIETNTGHHQAVDRPGRGLSVAAVAEDGVIEALEGEGFLVGVQWHPEAWAAESYSQALFSAFCSAAAGKGL
jgi:putative glutamine amidotransferase